MPVPAAGDPDRSIPFSASFHLSMPSRSPGFVPRSMPGAPNTCLGIDLRRSKEMLVQKLFKVRIVGGFLAAQIYTNRGLGD